MNVKQPLTCVMSFTAWSILLGGGFSVWRGRTVVLCDLTHYDDSEGSTVYAYYTSVSSRYEAVGLYPGGGSDWFCCLIDPSGVTKFEVLGTSNSVEIYFNYNGDMGSLGSTLTGWADGRGGDDIIEGSDVEDVDYIEILHGGSGVDQIEGNNGDDTLHEDAQNDLICGDLESGATSTTRDHLWGGSGNDKLWGTEAPTSPAACGSGTNNDGGGDAGYDQCDNCSFPGYDVTCEAGLAARPACP